MEKGKIVKMKTPATGPTTWEKVKRFAATLPGKAALFLMKLPGNLFLTVVAISIFIWTAFWLCLLFIFRVIEFIVSPITAASRMARTKQQSA